MEEILLDSHKEISARIKTGTVIAIMERKIASKEEGEKHFSCRWQDNEEDAEKVWLEILEKVSRRFEYEIKEKLIVDINIKRREMTVGEQLF